MQFLIAILMPRLSIPEALIYENMEHFTNILETLDTAKFKKN